MASLSSENLETYSARLKVNEIATREGRSTTYRRSNLTDNGVRSFLIHGEVIIDVVLENRRVVVHVQDRYGALDCNEVGTVVEPEEAWFYNERF